VKAGSKLPRALIGRYRIDKRSDSQERAFWKDCQKRVAYNRCQVLLTGLALRVCGEGSYIERVIHIIWRGNHEEEYERTAAD
jgi:hypothetical protein